MLGCLIIKTHEVIQTFSHFLIYLINPPFVIIWTKQACSGKKVRMEYRRLNY